MKRKLILISFDAVSHEDLTMLREMPNFSSLINRGTLVNSVDSVFISNTYPAHASIITGCHPNRHGVIENCLFQPERNNPYWRWQRKYIKTTTLFDEARKAGLTTCSILWPVTGKAKITYNFPEIFPVDTSQSQLSLSLNNGSKLYSVSMFLRFGLGKLKGVKQPYLDDFVSDTAVYTIKHKKPDLTMVHLTDVDSAKHHFGPDSKEVRLALQRLDNRLEKLLMALKDAKIEKETSIIVLGDHSCLPVHTSVDLNKIAALPESAVFHQAGGTAFLHVANPEQKQKALETVEKLLKDTTSGVSRLVLPEEMAIGGFDRDFILGVEASEGYCFGTPYSGQHGYTLRHDHYKTFYLAAGEGIPERRSISGGCIVDICPLAVNLLNLAPWEMDGISKI